MASHDPGAGADAGAGAADEATVLGDLVDWQLSNACHVESPLPAEGQGWRRSFGSLVERPPPLDGEDWQRNRGSLIGSAPSLVGEGWRRSLGRINGSPSPVEGEGWGRSLGSLAGSPPVVEGEAPTAALAGGPPPGAAAERGFGSLKMDFTSVERGFMAAFDGGASAASGSAADEKAAARASRCSSRRKRKSKQRSDRRSRSWTSYGEQAAKLDSGVRRPSYLEMPLDDTSRVDDDELIQSISAGHRRFQPSGRLAPPLVEPVQVQSPPLHQHDAQNGTQTAHHFQSELRVLADDVSKVLYALQPQMLASRKLEARLSSLRAQILCMDPDAGNDLHDDVRDLLDQVAPVEASLHQEPVPQRVPSEKKPCVALAPLPGKHKQQMDADGSHGNGSSVGPKRLAPRQHSTRSPAADGPSKAICERRSCVSIKEESQDQKGFVAKSLGSRKPMLPTVEQMNRQARDAMKERYSVFRFYHDEGTCQAIARSDLFDFVTMLVIVLNALWISIDADNNEAGMINDAHWIFIVMENVFCIYFLWEWLIRFGAFRRKKDCLQDSWFIFDSVMLGLSILETWILVIFISLSSEFLGDAVSDRSFLRLVRILRMCRVARLSKVLVCLPELLILFKGVRVACKALVATMGLIAVIVYIFAILFRQLSRDTALEMKYFPSISRSMRMLLLTSVTPDLVDYFSEDFSDMPFYYGVLFFVFILLVSFTTLNLLLGVLVNVVASVSTAETENLQIEILRSELLRILSCADENGDQMITEEEFNDILKETELCQALRNANIDSPDLAAILKYMFEQFHGVVSLNELLDLIWDLRTSNVATMKDMINLRRLISVDFGRLEDRMLRLTQAVAAMVQEHGVATPHVVLEPGGRSSC